MRALSVSLRMSLCMRIKLLGIDMIETAYSSIDEFVRRTLDVIYLRAVDKILIIRPNRIQHLNDTGFEMLSSLYTLGKNAEETSKNISEKYGTEKERVLRDISEIINSISAIMQENYTSATMIQTIPFDHDSIKYPVLSEIALTYKCQNRCEFCYASSPYRGDDVEEMTTDQVKIIIDRICEEAHVPTISFTGGEPTLRRDLPELVAYATEKGMRTNLITNGIRTSDKDFVKALADAGLKSAQVSLESHDEEIHNRVTGNNNAYKNVVRGIHNLKNSGIYTHTNTTICSGNRDSLLPLVKFIKEEYDAPYLSMNMIITTGVARDNDNINIGYSTIGDIIKPVIRYCDELGIKFVWYSPTPYCIFNPVDHNLGAKSCACVSGLLSVNPEGQILPCSSYSRGIGSLLKHSFDHIWNSDQALYFRERRYIPPVCKKCELVTLCGGACPLYWENAGSFDEIERVQDTKPVFRNLLWSIENSFRVKTKGVEGLKTLRRK